MKRTFIVQAWVVWLISMSVLTLTTRNPLYILILLLIARLVGTSCAIDQNRVKIHFWRLAAIIIISSVIFNLLMVQVGQTVLFSFPRNWWLIGGPKTLEGAVYGAINGLILITLLAIFLTFNSVVSVSELVKLTPRAFSNLGLVILLAMTYIPETINHLQRIRDAQAIRGHRLKGFRDWRPIIIPLLVGGLERSMSLAESMVSRGYGSTTDARLPVVIQLILLGGLIFSFVGWLLTYQSGIWGWVLFVTGLLIIFFIVFLLGRNVKHTNYRPQPWHWQDWLIIITSIIILIFAFLPVPLIENSTLFYTPYPGVRLPGFDVVIGIGIFFLASPAIFVELLEK